MNPILLDFPAEIRTERLLIRTPRPGDGAMIYQGICESLELLRQWPASLSWAVHEPSVQTSEEFCRNSYADYTTRKTLNMIVLDRHTGEFLGSSGLHDIDWEVPKFEIGYWGRSRYSGRGYMTEAVTAITQFAFKQLGARRVACMIDERNMPSRRLAERAGFALEGILRNERKEPDGHLCHTCIYAKVK